MGIQKHQFDLSQGFVALPRSLRSHWIRKDPERFAAFFDLACDASWEPRAVWDDDKQKLINLEAGECIWSVNRLAQRWGWSREKTARFLSQLEAAGIIKSRQLTGSQQRAYKLCDFRELITKTGKRRQPNAEKPATDLATDRQLTGNNEPLKNHLEPLGTHTSVPAYVAKKAEPLEAVDAHQRVWLTPKEQSRLQAEFSTGGLSVLVVELSTYLGDHPRKFKDHAATIRNWGRRRFQDGLQFFEHPVTGAGFYKPWVIAEAQKAEAPHA